MNADATNLTPIPLHSFADEQSLKDASLNDVSDRYKSKASARVMERYNKNPEYREKQKANSRRRYQELKALAALAKQQGLQGGGSPEGV